MVILISFLAFLTLVQCEKQLIFAYSCTLSGTSYPPKKFSNLIADISSGLTPGGIRQLYILGRELRDRFIVKQTLLDDNYNPKQLIIRPLMVDKAVGSAYAVMAGLYPAGTGHIINSHKVRQSAVPPNNYDYSKWIKDLEAGALNYTYQSMPLTMTGKAVDVLVSAESQCDALKGYVSQNSHNWKDKLDNQKKKVATFFGKPEEEIKDVEELSELRELILYGLVEGKYKKGFEEDKDVYSETIEINKYIADLLLKNGDIKKLASTPILRDVMNNMNDTYMRYLNGSMTHNDLKYISLVGVDRSTIMAIAKGLIPEINQDILPMPASILLFELYKETQGENSYKVHFTYDKQNITFSIEEFFKKVADSTFTEEEFINRCNVEDSDGGSSWLLIAIIAIGVLLLVALGILIKVMVSKYISGKTTPEEEERILSEIQDQYKE